MPEIEVLLPSFGEDAGDSATITEIFATVNETIKADDDLLEIVTDKAAFAVPCPQAGTIKKILVATDELVKVGQPLCILETSLKQTPLPHARKS